MAIDIGPTLKRRREWAQLTQQELVDHTRMERSSSYISAIEKGKTSPTLEEMELLARYFRISVIELLEEAMQDSERRSGGGQAAPAPDDRVQRAFGALDEANQDLALDFMDLLGKHRLRR
jgi:transcriptional regulator with XRE-family HTH domain